MFDQSMKILVVDDFQVMRKVVITCLSQLGYKNIEEATDGVEAFDLMQKQEFDFVITDWEMPNMSGIELLREIRKSEEFKKIPVMMVTAEGLQENVIEAIRAGVNNYIVKPIDVEALREKMMKIFEELNQG
ncbi:MAG: response regulator [SAR324 cluster bacterium]|nr:response regulator [SAR324 cluster bacterium]